MPRKNHVNTTIDAGTTEQPPVQPSFPVVGIGASAGGLEAFTQLFQALPANTGMAYVVIQHLDPTRTSLLPSLLASLTSMPVHEGQQGMLLEPNHVYVIPSHADMTLEQDTLKLIPRPQDRKPHFTIDTFFHSLAREHRQQAIGVLLSGTASDGTVGMQEIKAEGGITFAQDEQSATFPQMPHNAIAAGGVDHVMPPQDIAREIARLSSHPYVFLAQPVETVEISAEEEGALTAILLELRQRTGVDFLSYKRGTLRRRVQHRMAILHIEQITEYEGYLREHVTEMEALYQDVLIPVTSFFRDEAAFSALVQHVFPGIIRHLAPGDTIHIWVPGCSTGEEAYSLLICLLEFLEAQHLQPPINLFATDINPKILMRARAGVYPASALGMVSHERLARFFIPEDQKHDAYRIGKDIRQRCVFAVHDVTKDPPFSQLDLVSCRNVFIYLGPALQQRALQSFHYALKPHGFLLLGTSESVDALAQFFTPVERRLRLYAKKDIKGAPLLGFTVSRSVQMASSLDRQQKGDLHMPEDMTQGDGIQQEADRLILTNYAPASVVVDADLEILQARGHTGPYLELPPGKTSLNLFKMARDGLRLGLRAAIHTARKDNRPVIRSGLQVAEAGTMREVRVTVLPLKGPPAGHYFLVLFDEITPSIPAPPPSEEQTGGVKRKSALARRVAALELELATSQAEMQGMLEERDAANEELQAANEEIRSSNEELQSINEELQTSQEELQSTNQELQASQEKLQSINQELTTANMALERRNEQLKVAQERADAIVETVREPLLVLSNDFHIERANAAFYQFFQTTPQETEKRPLYELGQGQWNVPYLRQLLDQIRTSDQPFHGLEIEQHFPLIGHKILLLNARRLVHEYEEAENHLILLAMEDITERKELERQKDVLLGIASHELKAPITGAKLTLQMQQQRLKSMGDEQSAKQLEKADAHLNRLIYLLDGLLDTTAIETGKFSLHPTSFAIDDLIRETCEELERITSSCHIVFAQEAHTEVYGDRERTGEVLNNLLTNAIKYAPRTRSIEVRAASDADMVTISVRDQGEGIPKEEQASIFERFYQVSSPEQKRRPGVGLGLYLAAEITKQQGGRIWVESAPGEGATFFFTLPRSPGALQKR